MIIQGQRRINSGFLCRWLHSVNQTNYLFILCEFSSNDDCQQFKSLPFITSNSIVGLRFVWWVLCVRGMSRRVGVRERPSFNQINALAFLVKSNAQTLRTLCNQFLSTFSRIHYTHNQNASNLFKSNENIVSKSQLYWSKLFAKHGPYLRRLKR